jgi:hypothetical protein
MAQTTIQILRCLTLGRYSMVVDDGGLEIEGPQPLAGPLPASIKARREELVEFLTEWADGVWPPGADSSLRWVQRESGRGLAAVLDVMEELQGKAA